MYLDCRVWLTLRSAPRSASLRQRTMEWAGEAGQPRPAATDLKYQPNYNLLRGIVRPSMTRGEKVAEVFCCILLSSSEVIKEKQLKEFPSVYIYFYSKVKMLLKSQMFFSDKLSEKFKIKAL